MTIKVVRKVVVHKYQMSDGRIVGFFPLRKKELPGFSHRVTIGEPGQWSNCKAVDWLSTDSKPSAKSAIYFHDKHVKA